MATTHPGTWVDGAIWQLSLKLRLLANFQQYKKNANGKDTMLQKKWTHLKSILYLLWL